ncbi:MAG TPA: inverse autotransporter beta domain-containing protein [Hyphomicrobium sp.]|nr:inverse autotransporter beta domain-containing protein [Hyphomicrobium sp.]
MRLARLFTMAAAAVTVAPSPASANETPKWGAHVDVGGWLGTERNLGELDLFVPLAQDNRTLFFTDLRIRVDDDGGNEGNFGLALRRMYASGWNLGAYAYYDRKRTDYGNFFNQATLGVEALGRDFDLRANAYLPFGERTKYAGSTSGGGTSFANIVGTTVQVTTLGGSLSQEYALQGFDAEVGWRVPIWAVEDNKALRLYAGIFHFDDDIVEAVTGPRLRAELTMYEVPYLPEESRLTLGAEFLEDDVRGSQGFAIARLRIPLQEERNERPLNWQERRMTDYVMRDVDIVTETKTTQAPAIVETATHTADGSAITVIDAATTPGADLAGAVANAGDDSTVIMQGAFAATMASAADVVQLQTGQTMMGAGTLAVTTQSGRTAVLTVAPGASINAGMNNFAGPAVSMGTDSTLTGMTINAFDVAGVTAVAGVEAWGVSGATITNNVISVTASTSNALAVRLINSTDALVSGNTLTATRTSVGGAAIALQMVNSSATVAGNSFDAIGGTTPYGVYRDDSTTSPGSTGNAAINGTPCQVIGGNNIGTIGFTNGMTCP